MARKIETTELRKRRRLNPLEFLKVWFPALLVFPFGAGGLSAAIVNAIGPAHPVLDVLSIVSTAGITAWGVGWMCFMLGHDDPALDFDDRRWQVVVDRNRRARPHGKAEKTRAKDVSYYRYSVWVEPQNEQLKLLVVSHEKEKVGILRWFARKTKKLYNTEHQQWGEGEAFSLATPDPEHYLEALGDAQIVAENLEDKSYAEGLNKRRLDLTATALQHPTLSAKTRARLDAAEEEAQRLLES